MRKSLLIAIALVLAIPPTGAAADAREALTRDEAMNWVPYELGGINTLAEAQRLGICIVESLYTAANFRAVDIDGNGTFDLIYDGPKVDCEDAWEGWETKLYLVGEDGAQIVFRANGSIRSIWRDSLNSPISFMLRDHGCCADTRVFYRFVDVRNHESTVEFTWTRKLMRIRRMEFPDSYLETDVITPKRPIQLRATAELVDHGIVFPIDDTLGTGNVVARFPHGTQIEIVGAIDHPDEKWRLVAARLSEATWSLQKRHSPTPDGLTTEVLGWVRWDDLH